jgi:hypothetical protein
MGLPGSASAPIHLSGGMKIDNLDATALVAVAFAFALISFVIAVAAIVVAIFALVRSAENARALAAPPRAGGASAADGGKKSN